MTLRCNSRRGRLCWMGGNKTGCREHPAVKGVRIPGASGGPGSESQGGVGRPPRGRGCSALVLRWFGPLDPCRQGPCGAGAGPRIGPPPRSPGLRQSSRLHCTTASQAGKSLPDHQQNFCRSDALICLVLLEFLLNMTVKVYRRIFHCSRVHG